MEKLEAAIEYVLRKSRRRLTRTEIVKYLYLADLSHFERYGRTLTGLDYSYYYYGPFNRDILNALERMDGKSIRETSHVADDGSEYYLYEPVGRIPSSDALSKEERAILNSVIVKWRGRPLRELLKYVYDKTEPMRKARPGESGIIRKYAGLRASTPME